MSSTKTNEQAGRCSADCCARQQVIMTRNRRCRHGDKLAWPCEATARLAAASCRCVRFPMHGGAPNRRSKYLTTTNGDDHHLNNIPHHAQRNEVYKAPAATHRKGRHNGEQQKCSQTVIVIDGPRIGFGQS